jgi:hypothetical protein
MVFIMKSFMYIHASNADNVINAKIISAISLTTLIRIDISQPLLVYIGFIFFVGIAVVSPSSRLFPDEWEDGIQCYYFVKYPQSLIARADTYLVVFTDYNGFLPRASKNLHINYSEK